MEINITQFFNDADAFDFASSAAERGDNAARETWDNALEHARKEAMLQTPDELQAMRDWAKSSGGWDAEEISAWSDEELNALFVQLVSGDRREMELCEDDEGEIDWSEYERLAKAGTISGCIFRTDAGEIYYSLSD